MAEDAAVPAEVDGNDLAPGYLDHRIRLADASAFEQMASRVRARVKPAETPAGAAPATLPQGATEATQGSLTSRIAKDVGKGLLVEPPRAIVKGIRDAYQNSINIAKELGDWTEQTFNLPVMYVSGKGVELVSAEEANKRGRLSDLATLPDIEAPKTVTGGMIKGITQFITGMAGANKLMKVAGVPAMTGTAGYGIAALKGAIANFSAFDPHQERLSNLIEKFPALQNPVTEFLASDPEDNAAEGRFKNALEGLGLGLLTDGFIKGVKVLREVRAARQAVDAVSPEAVAAAAKPELPKEAFKEMGAVDVAPDAPLVSIDAPDISPKGVTSAANTVSVFHGQGKGSSANKLEKTVKWFTDNADEAKKFGEKIVHSDVNTSDFMEVDFKRRFGDPLYSPDEMSELLKEAKDAGAPGIIVKRIRNFEGGPLTTTIAVLDESRIKPTEPPKIRINFARIDTPDDVKRVMQELADASKSGIDTARRGVQTFEQTKLSAEQLNAWDVLQSRRAGAPLNAEQSVAARQLWVSSADKLTQLAETAANTPNEANLFAFRKMLAVHDAVQKEVIAARTETARALSSWRIPVSSGTQRMQEVVAKLDAAGGGDVARLLAQRVAALGRAGMTTELTSVVEKSVYATTRDAVMEAWINGLLSNPTTHAANAISNSSILYLRMGERAIAARIGSALGTQGGVEAGEAGAQFFGHVQGLKDMFRYYAKMGRAFATEGTIGLKQAYAERPIGALGISDVTKLEHPPSISSEAFGLSSGSSLGRAADLAGQVVRTPGSALNQSDEFFKVIGYRMELNAQALRQATQEVNAGKITADALKSRVAQLIENPPENLHLAAVDSALYQTFTNAPPKFAQGLMRLTANHPALKVILPFMRTPANILNFTFERTPLAPILTSYRANVAAGGARADLAKAQMALGTGAMMVFADAALNGQISGRGTTELGVKQAQTREGWQPYSVKIGDRWYGYSRTDPVGSLIGMSADMAETFLNAQHEALDDPDTERLVTAGILAFAGNLTNKTYLSGLSGAIEALNDPQRSAEKWTQRLAGSIVPSGVAQIGRINDPTVREVYSMMDAIKARTPGLSKDLPPRMDMWGEPLKSESGLGKAYDAFSPIYTRQPTPEPIDQEILRNEVNIGMPPRKTSFDGVRIDMTQYPKEYARYVELAGNGVKHPAWNMGAKDFLNAVVTGKSPLSIIYQMKSDGPDGGKDLFIRSTISDYREMARRQLLTEFPELNKAVQEGKARQREMKMPVFSGSPTIQ